MKEPAWFVPDRFVTEDIDMGGFHYEAFIFKGKPKYRACGYCSRMVVDIWGQCANAYHVICRPL